MGVPFVDDNTLVVSAIVRLFGDCFFFNICQLILDLVGIRLNDINIIYNKHQSMKKRKIPMKWGKMIESILNNNVRI